MNNVKKKERINMKYPASPSDINSNYEECEKTSSFYPFTLVDEGNVIGHLILRNPYREKCI